MEPEVLVTAHRFAVPDPRVAASVSVIDRRSLDANPSLSLPDALRGRAGIEVRGLYGVMGIDSSVDLRGFGETAGSNTLILLDGLRLNPADSGPVSWSAIPVDSIQRIEIVRGAGTVLYGDRATGGVINIITDKSGTPRAWADAALGSFGYRAARASAAGSSGSSYFNLFGQYRTAEGYRDNNQQDSRALSGRAGHRLNDMGEAFLDFAGYVDSNGLPGALFRAQYESDPTQARFLNDNQRREGWRFRPGVAYQMSSDLWLEAEAAADIARLQSNAPSALYRDQRDREQFSVTPRVRWRHGLNGTPSETVIGLDFYDGESDVDSVSGFVGSNRQVARQESGAIYVQNTTEATAELALTLGVRGQRVEQRASDEAAGLDGSVTRTRYAADLGASWIATPDLRVFGRIGQTFRFPSTDELYGFDPITFTPVFRADLRPQHGHTGELGAEWRSERVRARGSIYRIELEDEIGFDYNTFANTNFPRTRRDGFEIEGEWRFAPDWRLGGSFTWQDPVFREGPDSGKTIPLTADRKGSAWLNWNGGSWGDHSLVVVALGERWYGGDTANARERLPGYATVDYRVGWTSKPWSLELKVLNATDKRYAPFAGYSVFAGYFYYPADGRAFYGSVRYDFR